MPRQFAGAGELRGDRPLPTPPSSTERHVDRDAVKPGVERRLPVERTEPAERANEPVLEDFSSVVPTAEDAVKRVVKSVLVGPDELAERLRIPREALVDQRTFAGLLRIHGTLPTPWTPTEGGRFPASWEVYEIVVSGQWSVVSQKNLEEIWRLSKMEPRLFCRARAILFD